MSNPTWQEVWINIAFRQAAWHLSWVVRSLLNTWPQGTVHPVFTCFVGLSWGASLRECQWGQVSFVPAACEYSCMHDPYNKIALCYILLVGHQIHTNFFLLPGEPLPLSFNPHTFSGFLPVAEKMNYSREGKRKLGSQSEQWLG